MTVDEFHTFMSGLPSWRGYCVDCLSNFSGESAETISGYLRSFVGMSRHAECGNCSESRVTFRFSRSA
jgi:hypothetical protein